MKLKKLLTEEQVLPLPRSNAKSSPSWIKDLKKPLETSLKAGEQPASPKHSFQSSVNRIRPYRSYWNSGASSGARGEIRTTISALGDAMRTSVPESYLFQDILEQLMEGFQAKETHCCSLFLGKKGFGPRLLPGGIERSS